MSEITELGHQQRFARAEKFSDLAQILTMDRYWVDKTMLRDDPVNTLYGHATVIGWNFW